MSRKSTQIKSAWSVVVDHLNVWNALNFPPAGAGALKWPRADWLSLLELNACRRLEVTSQCQIIMNRNVDTSLWACECTELKTKSPVSVESVSNVEMRMRLVVTSTTHCLVFVLDSEVAVFLMEFSLFFLKCTVAYSFSVVVCIKSVSSNLLLDASVFHRW